MLEGLPKPLSRLVLTFSPTLRANVRLCNVVLAVSMYFIPSFPFSLSLFIILSFFFPPALFALFSSFPVSVIPLHLFQFIFIFVLCDFLLLLIGGVGNQCQVVSIIKDTFCNGKESGDQQTHHGCHHSCPHWCYCPHCLA